jgi:hypothetical protein
MQRSWNCELRRWRGGDDPLGILCAASAFQNRLGQLFDE